MTPKSIADHLRVDRYGSFWLTDAIRPAPTVPVVPRQGYRVETYRDPKANFQVPVLAAAVSREKLFETFLALLDPLGDLVDVVLETSHDRNRRGHDDLYREHIDLPVLKSTLCDFEDMIVDDGCTGVAVLNPGIPLEVQFDEHKLLIMYGQDLSEFEAVLESAGLPKSEEMRFLTEAEHVHSSSDEFSRGFQELRYRLGLDESGDGDTFSWSG